MLRRQYEILSGYLPSQFGTAWLFFFWGGGLPHRCGSTMRLVLQGLVLSLATSVAARVHGEIAGGNLRRREGDDAATKGRTVGAVRRSVRHSNEPTTVSCDKTQTCMRVKHSIVTACEMQSSTAYGTVQWRTIQTQQHGPSRNDDRCVAAPSRTVNVQ